MMESDLLCPILHILSIWLEAIAFIVIIVKGIRFVSGKNTKSGNWADNLVGSFLSLSILFLLLLALSACQNEALSTGQVLADSLWAFLMLLLRQGWVLILVLILLSIVLHRKKQKEAAAENRTGESSLSSKKQKAVWFVCTFIIGVASAAWLHLHFHYEGLSLFLLVLLLWWIAGTLVLSSLYTKRKRRGAHEASEDR